MGEFVTNVDNVTATKPEIGGAVRTAPYGTPLPTDATSELDQAFVTLGYITTDGFTNSNPIESASVKAWGGDTIFNGETGRSDAFKAKFAEYKNAAVAKVVYGEDNVEVNTDGSIKAIHANCEEHEKRSWVIDEILSNGDKSRTVIANGTVTGLGDINHKEGEPLAYETTISALPDEKHKNKNGTPDTHVTYFA
ncbi:MAG: phage tail protein [Lachnospiraceae bacterium]|nr:phage tail protein [Lachnospiraceae bacterium]